MNRSPCPWQSEYSHIYMCINYKHTPSHFSQMTFFCKPSFLVVPLYRSSNETLSWKIHLLPCRLL
uniref:Uncharacterized protein n=1 Tax=Denticeps clupeoides TaxID=299321 RepID=A0AAY4EF82_9TELE